METFGLVFESSKAGGINIRIQYTVSKSKNHQPDQYLVEDSW